MVIGTKLRKQLLLAFTAACIAILSAQTIIRHFWILPTFEMMAKQNDRIDIQRVESQLQQQIDALSKMVFDSAAWDSMYDAAKNRRTAWFNNDYVIADALERLDVNGWYLYDTNATIIGGGSFDNNYQPYSPDILEVPQHLLDNDLIILPEEIIAESKAMTSKIHFLKINELPAVTVAYNVTKSDGTGSPVGTLLLWSFIDKEFIENLTPGLADDITYYQGEKAQALNAYITSFFGHENTVNTPIEHDKKLYIGVQDKHANLLFVLSIPMRERTYDRSLFDSSLITGLLISGSVFMLFYLYINQQLLRPLSEMFVSVSSALNHKDFTVRAEYKGDNELHQLGRGMNELFMLIETQRAEIIERHEKLRHISNTDAMTSLANRRALDTHLETLANDPENINENVSLIVADIDHFKLYNDYYGHDQGDKALCKVAQVLKAFTKRGTDFVARYGGEEFVIVLSNTDAQAALAVAETLRKAIESAAIVHEGRKDVKCVTLSIGIASKPVSQQFDSNTLFKQADEALYQAKAQGRNCCVLSR